MKFEVAIAIAVAWLIFRAVTKAIKKNKEKLQRGGQISNNSQNSAQEFIDKATAAREAQSQTAASEYARSKEGRSLEREIEEKSKRIIDPFLEATSLEEQRGHYDEEALTEEYTTTHEQGKTVAHHKHQLFDAKKDRKKAVQIHESAGKAREVKSFGQRTERKVKKVHPIARTLATQGGRKHAVIINEILKRPEF